MSIIDIGVFLGDIDFLFFGDGIKDFDVIINVMDFDFMVEIISSFFQIFIGSFIKLIKIIKVCFSKSDILFFIMKDVFSIILLLKVGSVLYVFYICYLQLVICEGLQVVCVLYCIFL